MKHDHSAFARIGHNQVCRLCTTLDRDILIEQLAADLWESRQTGEDYISWPEASDYWKRPFRQLAETAIESLSVKVML